MIFNIDNIKESKESLRDELKFPFISVRHSILGGDDKVSIMLAVATTTPDKWTNGIFENSDYARIEISNDGTVKYFGGANMKLRKKTVKSLQDAITHINEKMTIADIPANYNYFTSPKLKFIKYEWDGS